VNYLSREDGVKKAICWSTLWLAAIIASALIPKQVCSRTPAGPVQCNVDDLKAAVQESCPAAESDCCKRLPAPDGKTALTELIKGAATCTNSDRFNPCDDVIRARYDCYLKAWQETLETHRDNEETTPMEKLQLQKEIDGLKGRSVEIRGITEADCTEISCESCQSAAVCQERCKNNRSKMEDWRSLYKNTMRGNQYLDCDACLAHLEEYYQAQKQLFQANQLDMKQVYTREHINLMWGLLFGLSRASGKTPQGSDCLERAQKVLPHAMLPFVLPPDELVALLSDKLQKEGGLTPTEARQVLAKKEQVVDVIAALVKLFAESGRVPDIPPPELAAILTRLMDDNLENLRQMPVEKRLKLFGAMMGTLSPEDWEHYSQSSQEYRNTLARFLAAAIQRADTRTLEMLEAVGLTHAGLAKLIAAYLEERHKKDKRSFVQDMVKLFDSDIVIFNEEISERFFNMGDEAQKRIIKNKKLKIQIKRFVQNIRDEYPDIICKKRELTSPYLKSFLMPGYPISYYEDDAGLGVTAWNYSNYALLGASLAAEFLFINSDYETDAYYQVGVVGTYLFALNGLIGVLHAHWYEPPPKKQDRSAEVGLSFSNGRLAAVCRVRF
jgi:hypothetical protein